MAKLRLIRIFTETSADAENTNAQSLTVREIVSRLSPDRFDVTLTHAAEIDPRLASRPNTRFVSRTTRGNAIRFVTACIAANPDIYFYPQPSPSNEMYLHLHRILRLRARIVVHVVGTYSLMRNFQRPWFGGDSVIKAIRVADVVAGNSNAVALDAGREFGIPTITIHNGIDRRNFFPPSLRAPSNSLRILHVGSFRMYKRVHEVIHAASRYPQHRFTLIGDGEERSACERLASECRLQNVQFLGTVSPAQVGDAMRAADVFFFPSSVEGHPQVLGQAAACGLPAVARDCYRPDYILHGKTGFLAKTEGEMVHYLDELINSAALRCAFGKAASEHSLQFDWDRSAQQWVNIFERLARKAD